MAVGDQKQTVRGTARKLVVPTVVGVAGGVAGLVLSKTRGVRDSMPDIKKIGVGDLADDLRERLETVLGKGNDSAESEGSQPSPESTSSAGGRVRDRGELESRRLERRERRATRRRT